VLLRGRVPDWAARSSTDHCAIIPMSMEMIGNGIQEHFSAHLITSEHSFARLLTSMAMTLWWHQNVIPLPRRGPERHPCNDPAPMWQ
jgi:hypothetical protein